MRLCELCCMLWEAERDAEQLELDRAQKEEDERIARRREETARNRWRLQLRVQQQAVAPQLPVRAAQPPPVRRRRPRPPKSVRESLKAERAAAEAARAGDEAQEREEEKAVKAPSAQCDSEFLLHALANGPLARGPLLDSAAKLGCKPENLHRLE